ncbi:MAG: type II secretion system protein [Alphaproteobacteria bacterium]
MHNKLKAFTILEMSIVLVIIGLILGSIYGAADLINQSKLKAVIKEIYKYRVALNNFKSQYNALPGDFNAATTIWPSAGTANGNGNNAVEGGANSNTPLEDTYVYQHLYLGGMLAEFYVGGLQSGTRKIIGKNLPVSVYSAGTYDVYTEGVYGISATFLEFGSFNGAFNQYANGPILNAIDAFYIDKKIDDGIAYKGNVFSIRSSSNLSNNTCVTNVYYSTPSNYILSDKSVTCRMMILFTNNN